MAPKVLLELEALVASESLGHLLLLFSLRNSTC